MRVDIRSAERAKQAAKLIRWMSVKDARFRRHAVSKGAHGFYRVDMSGLGVELVNAAAMRAAGAHAAEIIGPVA